VSRPRGFHPQPLAEPDMASSSRATALKFASSAESLGARGDAMKFTKIITTC